jgi:hypothetical protein
MINISLTISKIETRKIERDVDQDIRSCKTRYFPDCF